VRFAPSGNFSAATSFPQPITLGATFDDELVRDVAGVISTEARAFSNAGRAGLDYWTPNINPFKDPRWGRGQETPGEDPSHLSSYVRVLLEGLENGEDKRYKKVLANCKHYAGYDMEEWGGKIRYSFDAKISTQDLVEYYLPSFQTCARDFKVGSIMCAYNAVNGGPSCKNEYLLKTILRKHWNWTEPHQWVTGDCGAVKHIYTDFHYAKTPEEGAAMALNAGTDLDCGNFSQAYLPKAFKKGLFQESKLDKALTRLYFSLIRLGYFDPPSSQPYRQLTHAAVDTISAQRLAYQAAVEGTVLLKNTNAFLPLHLRNRSIAMIGDWAMLVHRCKAAMKVERPI
jgi:xylan 1,4-beta-xylosidase